jgi:hypothetical protein
MYGSVGSRGGDPVIVGIIKNNGSNAITTTHNAMTFFFIIASLIDMKYVRSEVYRSFIVSYQSVNHILTLKKYLGSIHYK